MNCKFGLLCLSASLSLFLNADLAEAQLSIQRTTSAWNCQVLVEAYATAGMAADGSDITFSNLPPPNYFSTSYTDSDGASCSFGGASGSQDSYLDAACNVAVNGTTTNPQEWVYTATAGSSSGGGGGSTAGYSSLKPGSGILLRTNNKVTGSGSAEITGHIYFSSVNSATGSGGFAATYEGLVGGVDATFDRTSDGTGYLRVHVIAEEGLSLIVSESEYDTYLNNDTLHIWTKETVTRNSTNIQLLTNAQAGGGSGFPTSTVGGSFDLDYDTTDPYSIGFPFSTYCHFTAESVAGSPPNGVTEVWISTDSGDVQLYP